MASFESGSYFFFHTLVKVLFPRGRVPFLFCQPSNSSSSLSLVRWKVGRLGKSAVVHLFVWVEFFSELGGFHWTRISIQFRLRCTSVSVLGRFRRNKFSFQNWLHSPMVRGGGGGGRARGHSIGFNSRGLGGADSIEKWTLEKRTLHGTLKRGSIFSGPRSGVQSLEQWGHQRRAGKHFTVEREREEAFVWVFRGSGIGHWRTFCGIVCWFAEFS